jgi:hypothetical protein
LRRKVGLKGLKEIVFRLRKSRERAEGNSRKKYLDFFGEEVKMLYLYRPKSKKGSSLKL